MLLVFGKCPFRSWKNVLPVFQALHLHFIRKKSVTRTAISVNRPFIIRYISGKRAFFPLHVRYSCGHCLASRLHIPITRASSGSGGTFCHRITKFCIFFVRFPSVTYPFAGVTKPLNPSHTRPRSHYARTTS